MRVFAPALPDRALGRQPFLQIGELEFVVVKSCGNGGSTCVTYLAKAGLMDGVIFSFG